jgi:hypothetical protein
VPTQTEKLAHQRSMRRDERYRCVNPGCCCEIKIAKEPFVGSPVRQDLRCCCGSAMEKMP